MSAYIFMSMCVCAWAQVPMCAFTISNTIRGFLRNRASVVIYTWWHNRKPMLEWSSQNRSGHWEDPKRKMLFPGMLVLQRGWFGNFCLPSQNCRSSWSQASQNSVEARVYGHHCVPLYTWKTEGQQLAVLLTPWESLWGGTHTGGPQEVTSLA